MKRGPLSSRSFRLYFIGQAVSSIGDGVVPIALSFAVLELTRSHANPGGSPTDLGVILAAQALPLISLVLFGGVWSDRLSRQSVMLSSDLVRAGAQGASAALILTGTAHIWLLALLQAIYGAARAFFGPASTGLVPQTVEAEHVQQANALMGIGENLAAVVGPALGGVLVVAAGAGWGLAFDAAAFLVSAASLSMMRLAASALPARRRMLTELREGWEAFHSRSWLFLSVLSLTLIITVVFAPLDVLGPKVALEHLGGAGAWAAINTTIGIGAMLGGAVGLRWKPRFPLRAGFLLTLAGEPAMLLLLARGGPLAALIGFALFAGIGSTLFNVFWFTALQSEVPADELSRVSSWDHLGTYALTPLGLAFVGPIAVAIGISTALYAAAGLAVALALGVLAAPAVRNFRSAPLHAP